MRLETIINKVTNYKFFKIKNTQILHEKGCKEIRIQIEARKNSKPICSVCNNPTTIYDTRKARLFQFVPIVQQKKLCRNIIQGDHFSLTGRGAAGYNDQQHSADDAAGAKTGAENPSANGSL